MERHFCVWHFTGFPSAAPVASWQLLITTSSYPTHCFQASCQGIALSHCQECLFSLLLECSWSCVLAFLGALDQPLPLCVSLVVISAGSSDFCLFSQWHRYVWNCRDNQWMLVEVSVPLPRVKALQIRQGWGGARLLECRSPASSVLLPGLGRS